MGRRMEAGILLDLHSWVFERVRDKLGVGVCVNERPTPKPQFYLWPAGHLPSEPRTAHEPSMSLAAPPTLWWLPVLPHTHRPTTWHRATASSSAWDSWDICVLQLEQEGEQTCPTGQQGDGETKGTQRQISEMRDVWGAGPEGVPKSSPYVGPLREVHTSFLQVRGREPQPL